MDKNTARQLIKETFQNPFYKDSFVYFVKNLLNYIEEAPFIYRGNLIPDAFDPYIKTLERIGKYQDSEDKQIDILIVRLKKESSLEHARTMQRNFIAWYLNGSRGGKLKDAALVAFVAPNGKDWRFSLVKMEYKLGKTQTGRVRAKEELTPARRYSFLVGIYESSHTAQSRLAPILEDDINNPTLKQLEESFNIEKVTKEFFEKYHELYLRVKENLDELINRDSKIKSDFKQKNVGTVDFAKKLLGQIVFLYFLQKKGWFGVKRREKWGTGSKNFLRELFNKEHGDYKNFFNDILEPLFYEALRQDRSYDDDYYSRFDCRIPFLNGGLFDPLNNYDWVNTDIFLPNKLFSNEIKTKEGDIGTGVLDIFDRYNFTVKEDEPLEKEVAVDPEMLGKVFENLLEVKDRKSKGTYYTPREIVHYMCQESLINYLVTELEKKAPREDVEMLIKYGETVVEHEAEVINLGKETKTYSYKLPKSVRNNTKLIDEKLATIRVCDPAAGSGAFLVGMMNEIIRTRNVLTPYSKSRKDRTMYDFKRHAIQNCLYGVDIDPGAVEIAKLRLWLSLVVEEADIKQIKPLPNLDYKIMIGNSLIELLSPEFLAKTADHQRSELINKFSQAKKKFFEITSPSEKDKKREEINKLIGKIFEYDKDLIVDNLRQKIRGIQNQSRLFKDTKLEEGDRRQIKEIEDKISEFQKIKMPGPVDHFEWHINFSEVFGEKDGFDVVIANPPYVKEDTNRKAFDGLRNTECYQGKMDLWYIFGCKALDILKISGTMCFIATNNWVSNDGASKFRNKVIQNGRLVDFIDFGNYKVFAAGIQTMVYVLVKDSEPQQYSLTYGRLVNDSASPEAILEFLNSKQEIETSDFIRYKVDLSRKDFIDSYIKFTPPIFDRVLEKIKAEGSFRLQDDEIFSGIDIMQDFISKSNIDKLGGKFKVGDGVFVISNDEKAEKSWNTKELEIIKPYYTTREIKRYYANKANQFWVLYTGSEINHSISEYPNIKQHLDQFKKIITSANKPYGLHRTRDEKIFLGEKVLSTRKCSQPSFSYVDFPAYIARTFLIIKSNRINLKFLVGILNSKLTAFWLYHKGKLQGNLFQIDKVPLQTIPIKIAQEIKQDRVIDRVEKILNITKARDYLENPTKQAKVHEYEKQIDKMVYELYGLTKEEIKIIEGFKK